MITGLRRKMISMKENGTGWAVNFNPERPPRNACSARFMKSRALIIHQPELRGILTFPNFARDEDWYAFVFVARQFEGELIDSPEGHLKWIADEDVLNLNLWEGDRIFLPLLEGRGFFSGKFVYQNGRLVEHSLLVYPACDRPAADP